MRCPECENSVAEGDYCAKCGARVTEPTRQASSARRQLGDSEEVVLWSGSFSWKGLIREFGLCGLASLGLIYLKLNFSDPPIQQFALPCVGLVWVALAVWLVYQKLNVRYRLTNQRLIHERGILYRRVNRIETIDIDDIGYEQGLIERMIGVGKIRVSSSDVSHRRGLMLVGINHPRDVSELIEKARRDERMRYGLHVEAV